jgi:hypothetical protein
MLENYVNKLLARVHTEINDRPSYNSNLKLYIHKAHLYSLAVKELNAMINDYEFSSLEEEINFFKLIKPKLLMEQHYYYHRAQLLQQYVNLSKDSRDEIVTAKLRRIDSYFQVHHEFCTYYELGETDKDEEYFVRLSSRSKINLDYNLVDKNFNTTCEKGHAVGKMLSKKKLSTYLQKVLHLDPLHNMSNGLQIIGKLNFNGTPTELVELIYALKASDLLDDSIVRISEVLSHVFNISTLQTYKIWQKIKERKIDQTRLMTKMQQSLLKQITKEIES